MPGDDVAPTPVSDLAALKIKRATKLLGWRSPLDRGVMPIPLTKVGLEPRGAALAIATGACISASYALLSDHDLQRTKKTVTGGALGFFGGYLFLRGSRFDDAQTAAVFGGVITLLSIGSYARYRFR